MIKQAFKRISSSLQLKSTNITSVQPLLAQDFERVQKAAHGISLRLPEQRNAKHNYTESKEIIYIAHKHKILQIIT